MSKLNVGGLFTAGLVSILVGCGGPLENEPGLEEVESNLTMTKAAPSVGSCSSTQTLDRVTNASGQDVIRATCSIVCQKSAYSMGVWSSYIIKPGGAASDSASNYGPGSV